MNYRFVREKRSTTYGVRNGGEGKRGLSRCGKSRPLRGIKQEELSLGVVSTWRRCPQKIWNALR